ncbi:SDR family NAD(P)-dependent oxidoreductase [Nocardia sp. NPDC055029]
MSKVIAADGHRLDGAGKTALVTGASSGIGRAMSELLASKGFDVVLVARREPRLIELAAEIEQRWGRTGYPVRCDLSDPSAPADLVDVLKSRGITVDFLVNNAGYSQFGRYDSFDWATHEQRLRVLGIATLELTHRLLPPMVERGWGRIINVSSIGAMGNSTPQDAIYGCAKTMVLRFSESIDAEFRHAGIRCTASVPGFTDTEIYDTSNISSFVHGNPVFRAALMRPATVASQAYNAVMSGKPTVVHGLHHRVMAAILLHAPLPIRRWMANRFVNDVQTDG